MQVSQNLFEWPTSTGIGLFAHLSFNFQKTWANHLSNTKDTSLSHTNLVASKHIKREESSFLVDVLHSKKLLLELPIIRTRTKCQENTHKCSKVWIFHLMQRSVLSLNQRPKQMKHSGSLLCNTPLEEKSLLNAVSRSQCGRCVAFGTGVSQVNHSSSIGNGGNRPKRPFHQISTIDFIQEVLYLKIFFLIYSMYESSIEKYITDLSYFFGFRFIPCKICIMNWDLVQRHKNFLMLFGILEIISAMLKKKRHFFLSIAFVKKRHFILSLLFVFMLHIGDSIHI